LSFFRIYVISTFNVPVINIKPQNNISNECKANYTAYIQKATTRAEQHREISFLVLCPK